MATLTASINATNFQSYSVFTASTQKSARAQSAGATDSVLFGSNPLSTQDSLNIVVERSYDKLRAVVDQARADLGIPEGSAFDTSAAATANRIADFALGAFERYRANHKDLTDDEAKSQFVDLIGGAIEQGISEARGILESLSALTPEVDDKINTIADIIRQRLQDFLAGGQDA